MKKMPKGKKTYPSGFVLDYESVKYNPELDKYSNVVLFPKKLALAKAQIEKFGLPEDVMPSPKNKKAK